MPLAAEHESSKLPVIACNSLVVSRRLNSRGAEALAEVWQQRPAQCGLLVAGKAMYISFLRKIFAL